MSQGPILIFDKSTLESLSVNEAVLLDNFYRSNITPLFFVECLADLERKMVRMRGTPEQLVGSLAERTPDMQSSANVHHMQILQGELLGQFNLDTALLRPFIASGQVVQLGDSKGMLFRASQEEEAVQRWARHQFLELERQIAKGWRRMLEQIDLPAMSRTVIQSIGPWRKPTSLQDARRMTDTIINHFDPEWLLRFGLNLLGIPEAVEYVVVDWKNHRKKPLHEFRPYFLHMLSINIFFALVLETQLLRNVKPSHQIDLAYLYYLPFCAVFSSRDNFHVQVAPLFMNRAQQFVHGDDLKADLHRLNELYLQLPQEIREQGLYSFAPHPPDDGSYLTTRLWDAYLPAWRGDSKNITEVPQEIRDGLMELLAKFRQATPVSDAQVPTLDELAFAEVSGQIKPLKGDYFRIAKDVALKSYAEEVRKAPVVHPPGTHFSALLESLERVCGDSRHANVEVIFVSFELDEHRKRIVHGDKHAAEIRALGIHEFGEGTKRLLKAEYDKSPLLSMLILSTLYGAGKLGVVKFQPVIESEPTPARATYEDWEGKALVAYLDRHKL